MPITRTSPVVSNTFGVAFSNVNWMATSENSALNLVFSLILP